MISLDKFYRFIYILKMHRTVRKYKVAYYNLDH